MRDWEVYSTLTLDVSMKVKADSEDIAIQQANKLLDKLGMRRDTIQIDVFGEKVELEIHSSNVSVEDAYCAGEVV